MKKILFLMCVFLSMYGNNINDINSTKVFYNYKDFQNFIKSGEKYEKIVIYGGYLNTIDLLPNSNRCIYECEHSYDKEHLEKCKKDCKSK